MRERRDVTPLPTPVWIEVVIAILRFAPGAIFGAAIRFRQAARWAIVEPSYFAGVIIVSALLVGWGSAKFGVAFCDGVRDVVHWPRKF